MKIAIVDPTSHFKPYNGNSLNETSLGASWTAVIYLARELVKLGHKVYVLNHCDKPGEYDGVKYLCSKIPEDLSTSRVKENLRDVDVLIVNRTVEWHDCLEQFCGITGHRRYLLCTDSGGAEKGRPTEFEKYDKIISISDWLNEVNMTANYTISPDYFISIPLGVDIDLFKPVENPNRFNIGFWGAMVSARRPQLVYQVFNKVKQMAPQHPFKLHLIGSAAVWGGPADGKTSEANTRWQKMREEEYEKYLIPYKEDVVDYGDVPLSELAKIVPNMGMFLYPTITETCGVSILEAQAAGVPVIVPDDSMRSAVKERVYHTETGVIRNFGNIQEVADAVIDMATNDYVYDKCRDNARNKVVRENDWGTIAKQWERLVLTAPSVKEIQTKKMVMRQKEVVGVGILSFQNRDLLAKCITSLKQNVNMQVKIVVWDNASAKYGHNNAEYIRQQHPDVYLIEAPENQYCTQSRNGVIEYFRTNYPEMKYMLFSDMDVIFKRDFLYPMVEVMEKYPDAGIVAYPEANCGFRPDESNGRVSEVMSICNLHRLKSFDIFPNPNRPFDENFKVYSFDSWICQILNLNRWHTYLVQGRKGYDHIGGQIDQVLKDRDENGKTRAENIKHADVVYWQEIANGLSRKKIWEDKNSADYIVIGNQLKEEGKYEDAKAEYLEGISRYPADMTLQFCLGNLYKDLKDYTKAKIYYQNVVDRDTDNGRIVKVLYILNEINKGVVK